MARLQPEPATQLEAGGKKRFFPTWLLCGCWKRAPKEGEEAKKKVSAVAGLISRFFRMQSGEPAIRSLLSPTRATAKRLAAAGERHSVGAEVKGRQQPDGWVGLCQERSILGRILEHTQDTGPSRPVSPCPSSTQTPPCLAHSPIPPKAHSPSESQLFPFSVLPKFCISFYSGSNITKNSLQRSIMGRIGSLFKKSDDKQAPAGPATSNPYAQQQPPPQRPQGSNPYAQDQHQTYSQYNANQFNANQYNVNQQYSQGRQGPASGLPSGPRPGGLPSRVAPGPRRSGAGESNNSGLPGYAEQPLDSQPPPPYQSPSLASSSGSPALPSNRTSPSVGPGYPREKFGASDGVGRNRFESSAPSHDHSASLPSQRQGGYGNLDSSNEGLFLNYNGPSKPITRPNPAQNYDSYGTPVQDADSQLMTEEERQEAEVQDTKAQITREIQESVQTSERIRYGVDQAFERMLETTMQTEEQRKKLAGAQGNLMATGTVDPKRIPGHHIANLMFRHSEQQSNRQPGCSRWCPENVELYRQQQDGDSVPRGKENGLRPGTSRWSGGVATARGRGSTKTRGPER